MIALVGARSGSKRLPGKNLRELGGIPLICWTLEAALESECFTEVYVSTDSAEIAEVAACLSEVIMRPPHMASDTSPDLEWIHHALGTIRHRSHKQGSVCAPCSLGQDCMLSREYCLLRPTNPFRGPETIQRAILQWEDIKGKYDSLRAVRKVSEHPNKMWAFARFVDESQRIHPIRGTPQYYNLPTQELFTCYIQTGGLEIAWCRTPLELNSISGDRVAGFIMEGHEALDLNTEEDWKRAEAICNQVLS